MGYNGTENFAKGKRFGFFPSYSLSWIVTEEPFFPKTDLVPFLKFRGSYGEVGNDRIGGDRFLYRPSSYDTQTGNQHGYFFGTVGQNYNRYTGMLEGKIGNPDITWERAEKTNVGMELGLFKGKKLSFTGDYFYEYRNSILANRGTIPAIIGANLPAGNIGIMENSGFEFDLGFRENIGTLNYWVKANYTFAHNKILFRDEAINIDNPLHKQTGNPHGQHFVLLEEGFFNSWDEINDPNRPAQMWNNNRLQPGDIKYKDVNNDGFVNQNDIVPIGHTDIPEIVYGISFGFDYKGFDVSVLFQGTDNVSGYFFGRSVYPFIKKEESAKALIMERWTPERYDQGLPITFPRLTMEPDDKTDNNFQKSTFWVRDTDYLRLKNVEIGYSFDKKLTNKLKIAGLRMFMNGTNLYTWLPNHAFADQFDPETRGQGSDDMSYNHPQMKTFNFGVSVKF
jgi:TonB-linked SusC/RagA family outer membrane protein